MRRTDFGIPRHANCDKGIPAINLANLATKGESIMAFVSESQATEVPQDNLRQAFEAFNQMSQQLSDSYTRLENQVQSLSGELAEVTEARMKELKEKEQIADRLHTLLHVLPGGVVVLNGNGVVQQCNPAALAMLGTDEVVEQRWVDIINRCFQPRKDDGHEVSLKDGKRLSIQTTSLENEPGQIVLMIDQTETRQLQDKLSLHKRLTAMGKMVASLAHQIRTPLSGALLYAQHLGSRQLDEINQRRFSRKLTRQLKNIESQVRDMLIFARGSSPLNSVMELTELSQMIEDSKQILKSQHTVEFSVKLLEGKGYIQCHPESLIGAIQNLLSNGIEAAESEGKNAEIFIEFKEQANKLHLSIYDNGPGIKTDTNEQLTEPFFTTKSNGTGLGLPVVNAVVRAHHGQLQYANYRWCERTNTRHKVYGEPSENESNGLLSVFHTPLTSSNVDMTDMKKNIDDQYSNQLSGACFTIVLPMKTQQEIVPTGELAHV